MIAQIGLYSLLILCSLPVLTGLNWNPLLFYFTGAGIIGCLTLPLLWIKIQSNPVMWLITSIVDSSSRLKLIGIWLLCIFAAVLVVFRQVWSGSQATTSVRKYFHFLIVIVFMTGKNHKIWDLRVARRHIGVSTVSLSKRWWYRQSLVKLTFSNFTPN